MTRSRSWRPSYVTKPITRRRFVRGAAAAAGAAAILACTGDSGNEIGLQASDNALKPGGVWYARDDWALADDSAKAVPGGVFPGFVTIDVPNTLDHLIGDYNPVGQVVYEWQLRNNFGPGIQPGTPEAEAILPGLAESWEVSPDGLRYTFKLRPGVKFHNVPPVNGREMDMEDWRTSDERFAAGAFQRNALVNARDRVEIPDSRTMVFILKSPYAELPNRMADNRTHYPIMPRELNENDLARTLAIGTSSRILDQAQPGISLQFRRNDDYWAGKPFIDRWHYPIIPEHANRLAQFIGQNVQSFVPTPQDALNVRGDTPNAVMYGIQPSQISFRRMSFGKVNLEQQGYNDVRVRIAMRRAVDWDAITDFLANKQSFTNAGVDLETSMATHIFQNPAYWLDPRKGELGEVSQNYLFDIAEAKKLVTAAGFPNGFETTIFVPVTPTAQQPSTDEHILTRDALNRSGVVKLTEHQFPTNGAAPYYQTNEFTGVLSPVGAGGGSVDAHMARFYHATEATHAFRGDPVMMDLIDKQRREVDPQRRIEIIKDFQRYAGKVFYHIPATGNFGSFAFYWPWLHNWPWHHEIYQSYLVDQGLQAHRQWLDPDMPRRNG